ncbi:segregation/condensation protein A [Kocuria palustris]|jgi:segregation and condensation protein A|uniref:segregation and condensation protein A n=1 Tax=Kocuria palustris TaxID=71999 RepID=UPI0019D1670D|nr:ScpA family protein [Kocuria palustris]MBN6753370.1 segregation/condensation protein A [Kocuria palustris]MBN6758115.1 segregation/condensation protein A [Kocuria palustris]MBN6763143.1 segregation/condensation protein A [Kocuria palustris]MBN6782875.1 segregation/condensation protein A [Kocuria palustris]MBN6799012.1 segregation/condensation protein A [Kocuria palustris]
MSALVPEIESSGLAGSEGGFAVELENFAGPFEVLLGLIGKHELDITTVSLSMVTDEFLDYVRALRETNSLAALDAASEFLVVAATLLDLKAARLLPRGEVDDEADLAVLEARDLLFARLLQYKAFKDMSQLMAQTMRTESARQARSVPLEPQFAKLMPELIWRTTPEEFAQIAIRALTPKEAAPTEVGVDHLHGSEVTVREEADQLRLMLADGQEHAFAELIADAETVLVVVVRFLSVLELFRDRAIDVRQDEPLADVWITWTAPEDWSPERLSDEHDVPAPTDPAAEGPAAQGTPHD